MRRLSDCRLEPGLSPDELATAAQAFGVSFPPLWAAVLLDVHPVALPVPPRDPDGVLRWTRYPDWRCREPERTRRMVQQGTAPGLPPLVPLRGHWYAGWADGHPVLSIVGADVWTVAPTLAALLGAEPVEPVDLPYWTSPPA